MVNLPGRGLDSPISHYRHRTPPSLQAMPVACSRVDVQWGGYGIALAERRERLPVGPNAGLAVYAVFQPPVLAESPCIERAQSCHSEGAAVDFGGVPARHSSCRRARALRSGILGAADVRRGCDCSYSAVLRTRYGTLRRAVDIHR